MTLQEAISRFGREAKSKLSNRSASGAPEDQLRAPLEALVASLAELAGLPRGSIVAVGETSLAELRRGRTMQRQARLLHHGVPARPARPGRVDASGILRRRRRSWTGNGPDSRLSIRETGHAGYRLHKLHCRGRPRKALTGQDVDTILSNLHGRTMSPTRDGLKIPSAWAGLEFAKLLEEHDRRTLAGDLLKPVRDSHGTS